MPTPREGLYELLIAESTIEGLVDDRIYSERLPDSFDKPAILYSLISGLPDQAFSGLTGVVDARYQIDIYAEQDDQSTCEQLREAILDLTGGYQAITVDGATWELLSFAPVDYGRYLPEPDTRDLRYSVDVLVQFGRS